MLTALFVLGTRVLTWKWNLLERSQRNPLAPETYPALELEFLKQWNEGNLIWRNRVNLAKPNDDWHSFPKPAKAFWAQPSSQVNDGSLPGTSTQHHAPLSSHLQRDYAFIYLYVCVYVFVLLLLNLHSLVLCWYMASTQFVEKLNSLIFVMKEVRQMLSLYMMYMFKQGWHILLISTQCYAWKSGKSC